MIDWTKFKSLLGNKHRKYVKKGSLHYHFVSYDRDNEEVTIMNTRSKYRLNTLPLQYFIDDFEFVKMTDEQPLF